MIQRNENAGRKDLQFCHFKDWTLGAKRADEKEILTPIFVKSPAPTL
jgi:hypothetical protein